MSRIPIYGFIIICTKCNSRQIIVENRQDGTDFQCTNCNNKLLIRPGEIINIKKKNKTINWKKVLNDMMQKDNED